MRAARWLQIKARFGRVLMAVLILSAAAGVIWFRRQASDTSEPAPPELPAGDSKAEMVIRDFRHVETRMDRTIWVLEAKEAEIFENKASMNNVKVTWYGEPGMVSVVATCDEGILYLKTQDALLQGNVRLARTDGSVLVTDLLYWTNSLKLLKSGGPVVITTPSFTFRAKRLKADLEQQKFQIEGDVKGEILGSALRGRSPS